MRLSNLSLYRHLTTINHLYTFWSKMKRRYIYIHILFLGSEKEWWFHEVVVSHVLLPIFSSIWGTRYILNPLLVSSLFPSFKIYMFGRHFYIDWVCVCTCACSHTCWRSENNFQDWVLSCHSLVLALRWSALATSTIRHRVILLNLYYFFRI